MLIVYLCKAHIIYILMFDNTTKSLFRLGRGPECVGLKNFYCMSNQGNREEDEMGKI